MKRLKSFSILLAAIALMLTATVTLTAPAFAAASGASIFSAKCAQCHLGGKNIINPTKTLSLADLQANGKDTVSAIVAQITNGKAPMPAFKVLLKADEIEAVSTYVLEKAQAGW
ncbi:c-type cytochrome [Prochlorothrix hollandica]|nr:c-type cytochrome [Prochlorothrix hollandica]